LPDAVVLRDLGYDAIIIFVGMHALTTLANSYMGITEKHAQAGDCVKARTVDEATREGYYAGINL